MVDESVVPTLLPESVFRYLVTREVSRALRYREYFSLWVVSANPVLGDAPIRERDLVGGVARALQARLRDSDSVGMLPDGLGIILAHVADELALHVAARIRQGVRQLTGLRDPEGRPHSLLVSIGGACFPRDGQTDTALWAHAFRCLALARQGNGDRIVYDASRA